MAIYGIGSNWNNVEVKEKFFKNNQIVIGWDKKSANFTLGMPCTYLSIKFDNNGNYISSKIYSFEF